MSQNSNVVGAILTGNAMGSGFVGWVSSNATILSLSFTAISCVAGVLFLFLNYRLNAKRLELDTKKGS